MKTICFCGMDGSGKSTQCKILVDRLRGSGLAVETIHTLTRGNTVSSRLQEKPLFKGFHQKLRALPCYGFLGGIKLIIGLVFFFIDAWITNIKHRWDFREKMVVYDRTFYDHLAIFAASFLKPPRWVINLAKVLPKCDVLIIMEVSPEIGHIRKSEDSIEKLTKCMKFYRRLASIFCIEIVDGQQTVDRISESIYRKSMKALVGIKTHK